MYVWCNFSGVRGIPLIAFWNSMRCFVDPCLMFFPHFTNILLKYLQILNSSSRARLSWCSLKNEVFFKLLPWFELICMIDPLFLFIILLVNDSCLYIHKTKKSREPTMYVLYITMSHFSVVTFFTTFYYNSDEKLVNNEMKKSKP